MAESGAEPEGVTDSGTDGFGELRICAEHLLSNVSPSEESLRVMRYVVQILTDPENLKRDVLYWEQQAADARDAREVRRKMAATVRKLTATVFTLAIGALTTYLGTLF